jgi:FKBP-type peptidyl-prolyl cis-trans isomerase
MRTVKRLFLITAALLAALAHAQEPLGITERGIQYRDLQTGQGEPVVVGSTAVIHVVMWRDDNGKRGREVYSSRSEQGPVSFVVGSGNIMPALNEGVIGMRPGGKRMLLVPPAFAYGERGLPGVAEADTSFLLLIELIDNG